SKVAVGPTRAVVMLPVRVQAPVAGSYSSADANPRLLPFSPAEPPAISSFPFESKVAVWPSLGSCMLPAELQVPASACARVEPVQGRSRISSSERPVSVRDMTDLEARERPLRALSELH